MKKILTSLIFLLGFTAPAFAHLNPAEHGSFAAGFTHPIFGMDHVIVMIAVGLWAWQIGGKAIIAVPLAFVAAMIVGFALSLLGAPLPLVEPTILASVVALGLLLTFAVKMPVALGAVVVAAFAMFHGHAHGSELGGATAFAYAAGFAIATAALHAGGIVIGIAIDKTLGKGDKTALLLSRAIGGITALVGVSLFFA
jgi:urease accessory protein